MFSTRKLLKLSAFCNCSFSANIQKCKCIKYSYFFNTVAKSIYNYSDLCVESTIIVLPKSTESANVKIVDKTGRVISSRDFKSISVNNEIEIGLCKINKEDYFFIRTTQENEQFHN